MRSWGDLMKIRGYSDEQVQFLIDNHTIPRKELTERFNKRFGTNKSVTTLKGVCNRYGLYTGRDGRFTTESSPRWQKGLSSEEFKSHYSDESFGAMVNPMIKSNRQHKVGDEIERHGASYIVLSEESGVAWDKRIKSKAVCVWEEANGIIPEGYILVHIDGDLTNCELDNLRALPFSYIRQFRWMFNGKWADAHPELKKSAIAVCDLLEVCKEARSCTNSYNTST